MEGVASVTVANAEHDRITQESRILRKKANQEGVRTRQMQIQQVQDEQGRWQKLHDPDARHRRDQERALQRSRNGPPLAEIYSGEALNALLEAIKNGQSPGMAPPEVQLDPAVLAHINLTDGSTHNGAGLLKDATKFHWPLSLCQETFEKERRQIEEMACKAVNAVKAGNVDAELLCRLDSAVAALRKSVDSAAPDLGTAQYPQAMRYLDSLKQSLKVLHDPNAINYFNNTWTAQGKTVDDLVRDMAEKGLKIAPAARGDEAAYSALHRALLTHDRQLQNAGR
jgi:hypothetical protein